jgi:anthranilate phosphoribosyltransferase
MTGAASLSVPPVANWPGLLTSLLCGQHLERAEAAWAMDQVMSGQATPTQLAAFLVALRAKQETVEELAGLADAMLRHAIRIEVPGPTVDVVGTGGDRHHTVNISTMASIVVAGTGRRVVKHGNRAASSSSGAADVLEALGVACPPRPGGGAGPSKWGYFASPGCSTRRCGTSAPFVPSWGSPQCSTSSAR